MRARSRHCYFARSLSLWLAALSCSAWAVHQPQLEGTTAAPSSNSAVRGIEADQPSFGLDAEATFNLSQAAVGSIPHDYVLTDSSGQQRRISEFHGKPLLVNFIYTGCFRVCPTSSRALRKSVLGMRDRFGVNQFNVVTIGFNPPSDSPTSMRDFAAQQRIDDPNWVFLTPRGEDVAALAKDFGFNYVATPMGYEHTLQVSIVDAAGVLFQQVYGDTFAADALGEPLRKLLGGALLSQGSSFADIFDKLRILCSVYDPETGRYRTDYSLYLEIAGGLTFALFMLWLALQEWRNRRARQHAAQ